MSGYIELQISSNFSFLRGASHPPELAGTAAEMGYSAIALTDRNTLSGIVLAHSFLKKKHPDTRLIVGCRLDLQDGPSLLCYPEDRHAYGRLTKLLTIGRRRAPKGECHLYRADIYEHAEGQQFLAPAPSVIDDGFVQHLREYRECIPSQSLHLGGAFPYRGDDLRYLKQVAELAESAGVPMAAVNDVLYHAPERKILQDVVTCIREKCTLAEAGFRLEANAERYLKRPGEMARLFSRWPEALRATTRIADRCRFSLDELRYEYPEEIVTPGKTAIQDLTDRTWEGARRRYQNGIPEAAARQIRHELKLIADREYAPYFLTVHEIVKFAQSEKILYQGRGSSANSIVCYCLEITQADPVKHGLLFERFISHARNEPPDIDVDFEHERREEVIQHVYQRYGRDRAGITATVVHYRTRRAVHEVGKVLGLSPDVTMALTGSVWGWSEKGVDETQVREAGLDPADRKVRLAMILARALIGFPRHLSQHVGGFVLSRGRLDELVPIENAAMKDRTIVQWEKDDLDELGLMKVDILALGMLTAIRKAFDLLKQHYGVTKTLSNIQHDPGVYEMLQTADSIGVFQVESRAQQSMLPRLKPKEFYDLVIEVAIVRPGPIQGDMVHPYLRRREGKETVEYPNEALENVLKKTLGVPLFQEQAMQIAIIGAGFTPDEADELRRSLATFRHVGTISSFRERFISGMLKNGLPLEFAERCFKQIEGFGTYGFPESHAISFANLVYVSAWIKHHYPDVFLAALLNSQPMGFYAPAQLVRCAKQHGVEIRPIDVNSSDWDTTLEPSEGRYRAARLGLRLVNGLPEREARALVSARNCPYRSVPEIAARAGVSRQALDRLAQADAFGSIAVDRRTALWQARNVEGRMPPLFSSSTAGLFEDPAAVLGAEQPGEKVYGDYAATGLTLRTHPVEILRPSLPVQTLTRASELKNIRNGTRLRVAGLVLFRQQPATAKGTIFLTLEDETGTVNLIVWKAVQEKFRRAIYRGKLLACIGELQREGQVMHVVAERFIDWTGYLDQLRPAGQPTAAGTRVRWRSRDFH